MAIFKATIEIILDVPGEGDACDAIAEAMRPLLREFAGAESCLIDWRYSEAAPLPVPDSGEGFEYQA